MELQQNKWLFDYNSAQSYEDFSLSEDIEGKIFDFLDKTFNFTNSKVLEIGSGSGKFTSFIAERCNSLMVVEKSEALMRLNKAKCKLKNISFILDDLKNVMFEDDSFDFIFAGWSLTSMRNCYNAILSKLYRCLKMNGLFIIVENAGNDEFSKLVGINELSSEMIAFYKNLGFVSKAVIPTKILLPNSNVFYRAFPNQKNVKLASLEIPHNVLIMYYQKEQENKWK